ncbi:MAG: aminotransferase class I/II-fold pyridoxal phosphate-dependent enzyme [Proteobacteria bacterium]|nr:aminotransferase class I/II-fold pyridoxal phosphate-dependent enzyme [Pseudomonadota bacterium]
MTNQIKPETVLAQGGGAHDAATGGVAPAIQLSSTYMRGPDNALLTENFYARYGTPNGRQAETAIAQLEGAADARLFSSGMAAGLAVFRALPAGAHVVATRRGYFSIVAWLTEQHARRALDVSFFDPRTPEALTDLVRKGETQLVWIETPVNPVYEVVDIAATAEAARGAGALLGVDSTAATPLLTRPIEHGADLVFHSATKYLNGHSDVLAGVLCTRDETLPLWKAIEQERTVGGATLGAFEAWLLLRGMRTMHLRVRQQCENALRIAHELERHPRVERVTYPGLPTHPQHATAVKQMRGGFGGMMSFEVKGGAAAALGVISRLKLVKVATSLGGVETLIEHRRSIEGPQSDVPEGLLRLSVGCEHADDLWADLNAALSAS